MGGLSPLPSASQQVPAGLGHPAAQTPLRHSTHPQLRREQVLGDAGSPPSKEEERGQEQLGARCGGGLWAKGPDGEGGGVLPAWDFICTLAKGVEEPQEPALCPPRPRWGEGLAGISTQLQPCPMGQSGETWCCLLPPCQAQTPPTWAGVLPWPWHGASLIMAMGPKGVVGEKGALGPRSTAHGPCHHLECGAQHHRALVPLVQDRQTGSRDGVRWGGSGWLAWCAGTWCAAAVGVLIPPMLSQHSRTLPHHTGKPPGLLPPRADGATRQCHPPCPRGTPPPGSQHPWRPVSLGTSHTPRKGLRATAPPQPLLGHQTG